MKSLLPLLVAFTALAQSPPAAPQNLRLVPTSAAAVGDVISVPLVTSNGQFIAYWYSPPYVERTNASIYIQPIANIWIPEYSVDGVTWDRTSDLLYLPPRTIRPLYQPCYSCLHVAQVPSSAQVRIRLVAY